VAGAKVEWSGVFAGEERRRTPLPAYPFERRYHMIGVDNFELKTEISNIEARERTIDQDLRIRSFDDWLGLRDKMTALSAAFIYRYFADHTEAQVGKTARIAEVQARLRVLPKFARMFKLLLDVLKSEGIAHLAGEEIRWLRAPQEEKIREGFLKEHGEFAGLVRFLEHCIRSYPAALSG
jgi:hypothetical protein